MPRRSRAFTQVDVFTATPLLGNPLAVVLDAEGMSDVQMQAFARWTNLSETTFVLPPTGPGADYRVRIFTAVQELPFAGHPTLGTCHAWLEAGGQPAGDRIVQECGAGLIQIRRQGGHLAFLGTCHAWLEAGGQPAGDRIVQECGAGLIQIRRQGGHLAFLCPPLLRSGPPSEAHVQQACRSLGVRPDEVVAAEWVDNGPGWLALRLRNRQAVLNLRPDFAAMEGLTLGVVAPWEAEVDGVEAQFEVRAFIPGEGMPEDPVTGSLNAGIAQWFYREGLVPEQYVVSQGTVLGCAGRVHVQRCGEAIWLGGEVTTCIEGQVSL
jgi:predicted PhzF superfamily epimerase YddE/YHI9